MGYSYYDSNSNFNNNYFKIIHVITYAYFPFHFGN